MQQIFSCKRISYSSDPRPGTRDQTPSDSITFFRIFDRCKLIPNQSSDKLMPLLPRAITLFELDGFGEAFQQWKARFKARLGAKIFGRGICDSMKRNAIGEIEHKIYYFEKCDMYSMILIACEMHYALLRSCEEITYIYSYTLQLQLHTYIYSIYYDDHSANYIGEGLRPD